MRSDPGGRAAQHPPSISQASVGQLLRHDAAPLHRLHLIAAPGMEQQRLAHGAERAHADLLGRHTGQLQLTAGGRADIEASAAGFRVALQRTAALQLSHGIEGPTSLRRQRCRHLLSHSQLHLVARTTHRRARAP